jgi:hypothetical protein
MARIHYDGEHRGRLLQRTLLGYLTRAITSLPADPLTIYELVVVGNPTMRDLFFGLDVQPIGVMPYRSTTEAALHDGRAASTSLSVEARRLRLPGVPARAGPRPAARRQPRRRRRRGLPAGDRDRRARLSSRRSWTSARTRRPSSATARACSRPRARRDRPSRAAA